MQHLAISMVPSSRRRSSMPVPVEFSTFTPAISSVSWFLTTFPTGSMDLERFPLIIPTARAATAAGINNRKSG